jgi:alpha-1,2-mannosyltransferase
MRVKALCVGALALVFLGFLLPWGPEMLDLKVYRVGGDALLHGLDLYAAREARTGLPFTYPVFAALLFVPYAVVPLAVAKAASLVVSLAALWAIVHLTLRYGWGAAAAKRWSAPLALVAVTAHPVLDTLMLGQINVVTTALVMADVLVVRGRFRGTLIGLATGIKLVSGLFVVYYLVTRQFRAAANALASFVGTVAIGFALRPRGAWEYWTHYMLDPDRVGGIAYVSNQSILGMASRLLRDPKPPSVLTLTLSAAAAVVALVAAARTHDELAAVCLVATGSLLASPISWGHHWVWVLPALAVLAVWARDLGGRWRWWVAGAVALVLWIGPMGFMPNSRLAELHHNLAQQIVANCYGALAVAFLVWATATTSLRVQQERGVGGDRDQLVHGERRLRHSGARSVGLAHVVGAGQHEGMSTVEVDRPPLVPVDRVGTEVEHLDHLTMRSGAAGGFGVGAGTVGLPEQRVLRAGSSDIEDDQAASR